MASDRIKRYNRDYQQAYYYKNREIILFKKKHYAKVNKERISAYHRAYYLLNKQEINLKHRQWYQNRKHESSKMSWIGM